MTAYRVHVSTDLGGDPDDIQSLYRLVHYSDILRIEGITSCTGPGSVPSAELIKHWIQRIDVNHLRRRGFNELMAEDEILGRIRQGPTTPGAPSPERRTEASDLIIENAHRPDREGLGRPLWVLVWGSITEVAQAIHDEPGIAARVRIYYIGSSNTVNDPASRDWLYHFMVNEYPDLWWIENGVMPHRSRDTFRGVYEGGDQSGEWHNIAFLTQNIRGRGSTHDGLFEERCGDAFPVAHGPKDALKEGDSPTMLYLLSPVVGGVGDVDDPSQESWGGTFTRPDPDRFPNYWTDLEAEADTCQSTISRWRVPFLSDWKARWERY